MLATQLSETDGAFYKSVIFPCESLLQFFPSSIIVAVEASTFRVKYSVPSRVTDGKYS